MNPILRFLLAARSMSKQGMKKEQILDFAKREFGESIIDVTDLAEEMIEIDRRGGGIKNIDQMLQGDGFFDIKIPKNPNRGIPNKELIEQLKKDLKQKEILKGAVPPKGRKPNAEGGRVKMAKGGLPNILGF